MAGGTGERFWPLSRANRPKQLLRLSSPNQSLLEEAVSRVAPLFGTEGVFVITGKSLYEPISATNLLPTSQIWVEPHKRNTLGALVWVAAKLTAQGDSDATLAILTADHRIADAEAFRASVNLALRTAESTGGLVTCGIHPTRPETGYGYIEPDTQMSDLGVYLAKSFREKPDSETAKQYAESGFLWNSGMFFWTVDAFSRQLQSARPDAHQTLLRIAERLECGDSDGAERVFAELPNISIDYALMERATDVYVVAADFGWDDIGAWDSLPRTLGVSEGGSTIFGNVLEIDGNGCVLYNASERAILTVIGAQDLIVVVTDDAVLVCPKDQAQRVKEIVEELKKNPNAPL